MRVVTSIYYLAMKFPTPTRVRYIKACQYNLRECYRKMMKKVSTKDRLVEENAKETQRSFRPIRSTKAKVNIVYTVYTVEFPIMFWNNIKNWVKNGIPLFFIEVYPSNGDAISIQIEGEAPSSSRPLIGEASGVWPRALMIESPPLKRCLESF